MAGYRGHLYPPAGRWAKEIALLDGALHYARGPME
jgi:hypothetical protein